MITLKCSCEAGSHILQYDEKTEKNLTDMIKEKGEYKRIHLLETGKTYLVPIAYILIHGIKGNDLPTLGFEEYEDNTPKGGEENARQSTRVKKTN